MNSTHCSVFYLYTFFLFLIVSYLMYLKFFYFTKYVDWITKVTTNLTTYLFILYLAAFSLSLAISISFHSATLMSESLAWYIINELDFEKLKAVQETQDYPLPGEWFVLDKQKGFSIDHMEGKINNSSITAKGESPCEPGAQKDYNHSTGKQEPHPPIENKKSFLWNVSNTFFGDIRQAAQQRVPSEGADLVKQAVVKSTMEPGNEKIALMIIDNLCDPTKALPASAIGVPNLEQEGVEPVAITYRRKMPDGSTVSYYCANSVKGLEVYNECDRIANGKPRFNLAERQVFAMGGKIAGHNKLICVAVKDISPSDNSNHFETDDRPESPRSPTNTPHNLYTW